MLRSCPSPVIAVAAFLLAPLPCQAAPIAGRVLGLDGAPQAYAVVRIFDAAGRRLTELVTDERGEFRYAPRSPDAAVAAGAFEIQWEGLVRRVEGGNPGEPVELSLAGLPHFTVRGTLLDPTGQPMADVDLLVRDELGAGVCTVTTDAGGAWRVMLGRPAAAIQVDPAGIGWHHEIPLAADRDLEIDLRDTDWRFFTIDGRVLDEDGAPVVDALVTAVTADRETLRRPTRGDGSFVLWSRKPLVRLVASRNGEPLALHVARFEGNRSCELDARVHGFVQVAGRVVDRHGAGVPYAMILPADARGEPITGLVPSGRSDANGNFTARVPRELPRLIAWQTEPPRRHGTAPWRPGEPVEIVVR